MPRARRAAIIGAIVIGGGLAASCDTPAGGGSTPTTVTTPAPTTDIGTGTLTTAEPTTPVLADGRHPVFLKSADAAGKTVTFDLIEFYTGTAALNAWKTDHPGETGGPDNDYYIINKNPKLRTLPVTATVTVTVVDSTTPVWTDKPLVFGKLHAFLSQPGINPTFWLTVNAGTVTQIEQQFLP